VQQESMSNWFETSVEKVKGDADWFEKNYFIPWKNAAGQFFHAHPVVFTFAAFFLAMSALPIASFLGFTVLTLSFLTFAAVLFALFTSAVVVIAAGCFLAFVLSIQLVISGLLTISTVMGFVAYRLFFHLRDPQGKGVRGWTHETRESLRMGSESLDQKYGTQVSGNNLLKREPEPMT